MIPLTFSTCLSNERLPLIGPTLLNHTLSPDLAELGAPPPAPPPPHPTTPPPGPGLAGGRGKCAGATQEVVQTLTWFKTVIIIWCSR